MERVQVAYDPNNLVFFGLPSLVVESPDYNHTDIVRQQTAEGRRRELHATRESHFPLVVSCEEAGKIK
jgi:hypothetical protein